MPNHKSAEKRMRQNEVRSERNRTVRSRLRTYTNHFERAVASGNLEEAEAHLRKLESEFDRAASKGVIPKNRASRRASRAAQRLNAARSNS